MDELGIPLGNLEYAKVNHIKANSITKEVRQRQLQKFFKAIFSHVSLVVIFFFKATKKARHAFYQNIHCLKQIYILNEQDLVKNEGNLILAGIQSRY